MPFDVVVPDLLPTEATTDTANFVTWETGTQGAPAVRFLLPVDVYVPGDSEASPPPDDYLTYLLGQRRMGRPSPINPKRRSTGCQPHW